MQFLLLLAAAVVVVAVGLQMLLVCICRQFLPLLSKPVAVL